MIPTVNRIIDILDDQNIEADIKNVCDLLLQAQSDWPTSYKTMNSFIAEIKMIVGGDLNKESIEKQCNKYLPSQDSWKMESLACLVNIFEYGNQTTLEEIFLDIDNRLTKYNRD